MLFDDFIINILLVLYIYLLIFIAYYAFNVFKSTKRNQIGLEQKYIARDLPGNLITIIYAKTGDKGVVELVRMLKEQKYPKENYQIHVLFDNSKDDYSDIIEQAGGVKVWRINNGSEMGKDNALPWLLERLISFRNVNAFVFLDANRKINPDFLRNINTALFSSDVVVPAIEYVTSAGDVIAAIKNCAKKYENRIYNTARAVQGLMSPISSGAVAIKQEVLEKLQCVDFKDKETEYKYSIFLASHGHVPIFAPDVKTRIPYELDKKLSLKQKASVIQFALTKMFSGSKIFLEFILSFFKPKALTILLLYTVFFVFLYNFEVKNVVFENVTFVAGAAGVTLLVFLISLAVAKDERINPLFLCFTPLYDLLEFIFRPKGKLDDIDSPDLFAVPVGAGIPVIVTDSESVLKCSIEMKNTGDGFQAVFRYKGRTLVSEIVNFPKAALDELINKLGKNGLKIHICAGCSHFGFKPNSPAETQKGLCSQKDKMTGDIQPETSLLDTCKYFQAMSDLNNVVEFKKNEKNDEQKSDENNEEHE